MVVGGNIEGFTRVMTTSIALETSKGDLPLALALGVLLLLVVLLLNALIALIRQILDSREQPNDIPNFTLLYQRYHISVYWLHKRV